MCRSNDTTTATGILAPRVEIRHVFLLLLLFCFVARWVSVRTKKKKKLSQLFEFALPRSELGVYTDLTGFTQSNPTDASSPSSLTQHQFDAREREG